MNRVEKIIKAFSDEPFMHMRIKDDDRLFIDKEEVKAFLKKHLEEIRMDGVNEGIQSMQNVMAKNNQ